MTNRGDILYDGAKHRKCLQLAACIRRAHEGPVSPIEPFTPKHVGKEDPSNDYYWHTRETCHKIARGLGLFFPDVLSLYTHETKAMSKGKLEELSEEFWFDVLHPDLLVREVMES